MNRFNLTFSGEIQQGEKPDAVKLRFGEKFAIEDPDRLERFFSGEEVILRRNLDRKEAAECFQEMRQLGVVAELVKVSADEAVAEVIDPAHEPDDKSPAKTSRAPLPPAATNDSPDTKPVRKKKQQNKKAAATTQKKRGKKAVKKDPAPGQQEASRLTSEREARERAELERQQAEAEKQRALEALREAEEAAQHRLEEEVARRKAEEEAARAAHASEAAQREKARRDAEAEAARSAEQEAEARRETEQIKQVAAKERQRAEELARQNAQLQAQWREATEKAAALEAALKESAEQAREEARQQKARAEKRLAREKERLAKEEARLARTAAAREARLEKERREAQAKAEKREAELAGKVHQAEERLKQMQAAERKAREAARQAQDEAREQLLLEAQERAMEEQAIDRAASALSGKVGLGPARASTRTSLEVPQRSGNDAGRATRKRQPGEPNFYTLQPFRNTQAVRERATQAGSAARRLASLGALAVAALAALTGAFLNYTPAPAVNSVSGVAVTPAGGPVLLAGDQLFLHDRSGKPEGQLTLADLGVARLSPPLEFETGGTLLALGSLKAGGATQLLRCDLTGGACNALPDLPENIDVVAYSSNPINGELILLDAHTQALLKTTATGDVRARKVHALPEPPALRLHAGLLLVNSSTGPGVSVLRYDDSAFGEQLDEVLLVPAAAVAAEHSRVGDFLFSGGNWWVTLYNPASSSAGLYRFDSQWNYLDQAALNRGSLPLALTNWGDKTLVNDGRDVALSRFNSSGGVEVPLTSAPIESLADDSRLRNRLLDAAWRAALVALALLALLAFAGAYLQHLRHLVYRSTKERGADPVDDLLDDVEWISAAEGRERTLRTRLISYGCLALAVLLIAVGQQLGVLQLAALILFLLGPGIALAIVTRSSAGHIGVSAQQLLLVEPAGTYHLGHGADLLYRGNLLFIDDVALYTGSKLLPAFSPDEIARRVKPLVEGGVRIDARTTLTRLLQSRHPLARGITAIAASFFGAVALLVAGGIF